MWAMDFVHDQLATGRKIRVLTVVDTFSRFSPVIDARFNYGARTSWRRLTKRVARRTLLMSAGAFGGARQRETRTQIWTQVGPQGCWSTGCARQRSRSLDVLRSVPFAFLRCPRAGFLLMGTMSKDQQAADTSKN